MKNIVPVMSVSVTLIRSLRRHLKRQIKRRNSAQRAGRNERGENLTPRLTTKMLFAVHSDDISSASFNMSHSSARVSAAPLIRADMLSSNTPEEGIAGLSAPGSPCAACAEGITVNPFG